MLLHSVDRRVTGRPCVRRWPDSRARASPRGHHALRRGLSAARNLQPGTSVLGRCAAATDHRPRGFRDIPAIAECERPRLWFMCAVTRHTGGTRGVGHGPSNGRRCCEGWQRRSRPRVTSRATMSDRPRAWNASGGTHRTIIDRLPRSSGRRFRFQARKRGGKRAAGSHATASPPSAPAEVRSSGDTQRGSVNVCVWRAAANRDFAASARTASGWADRLDSGSFPGRVEAARTGEVMRSRDQGASSVP